MPAALYVEPRVMVDVVAAPTCSLNESVPSNAVSATDCHSDTANGSLCTNVSTASRLAAEKTGSLCVWRLSAAQIPAYAMIVEPEPGSTAESLARAPAQPPAAPSKVWSAPNWWPSSWAR